MKFWQRILCFGMVSVVLVACDNEKESATSQNLIFHETFEGPEPLSAVHNKEVGDWDYALQYVNEPVYDGVLSARFEIRQDQPLVADGKRAETTIIFGTNELLTKDAWYSFAVYFPAEHFQTDPTVDVISQWYKDGSPVRLITKGERILVDIGSDGTFNEEIKVADLVRDVWHEFVFHFIHSPGDDGHLQVWHNGVEKVNRAGGNLYSEFLPKWKIGIYKSAYETGVSSVPYRVVLFDNIKVGNENATYRDMEPARP